MNLLIGTRILDLTQMLAGPFGTMMLADMGAEVIKIEEPGIGDRTRTMGPHFVAGTSAYFVSVNRNKKSMTLNLKENAGREIFYDLVKKSDVVFDNFRPGVLERLKCDYESLKKVNPKIICCSISAFGQNGPYREMPAFDLSIQALSGVMSYTGEPERAPVRMGIPMGDLAGAMYAAFAVAAALHSRDEKGNGCRIDISLLDSITALHTYVAQYYFFSGELPKPIGSGHQSVVPYQAFRTKDMYIVIAVYTDKFWEGLCKALGVEHLINDPKFATNEKRRDHRQELIKILSEAFEKKNGAEWLALLEKEGVPCGPINTLDKTLSDRQLLERNMVVELDIPDYGKLKTLGNPVKVEGSKERFVHSPKLGEHTEMILRDILGYSEEDVKKLKSIKAI